MVRLFVSDRILVDSRICNGGVVVNNVGKIQEVFKNETETSDWLDQNHHVEVSPQKPELFQIGFSEKRAQLKLFFDGF